MKMILIFAIVLMAFVVTSFGQAGAKKATKSPTKKVATKVEKMSDLASSQVCVGPVKHKLPVDGVVVKRQFDEDEMTLIGVVVRESDDQRYFVNIDHEYVAGKGRFVPSELSRLLSKGRKVKIWVYGCGASGMMFWARVVSAY